MIAVSTKERYQTSEKPVLIRWLKSLLKASEVSSQKNPIMWYEAPDMNSLSNIVFKPILELQSPTTLPSALGIDCLLHVSSLLGSSKMRP